MQGSEPMVRTGAGVSGVSAVSWGAIAAGTVAAAAVSLVLFALAAGLDLASISAWPRRNASVASLTTLAAITLVVTQWISAGIGGYITGRLRTSWVGTHTHEVFFRDTAHGFITWCMATVLLASGLIGATASSTRTALRVGAGGNTPAVLTGAYRSDATPVVQGPVMQDSAVPAEPLTNYNLARERLAQPERAAGRLVLPVTSASTPQAIADTADVADAREAATSSVLTALAMCVGAFIACVTAALGGRLRDLHP
jgi:hypothetical protein